MEELQVPTKRVRVQIRTRDGRSMIGDLFLAENPFDTALPFAIARTLNDDRAFLPFMPEDDAEAPAGINKRHVARIRVGNDAGAEVDTDGLDPFPCTLQLEDGSSIDGGIVVETPIHCSRLIDKLNHAPRFVPVVSERGLDFVQTAQIVCVQ